MYKSNDSLPSAKRIGIKKVSFNNFDVVSEIKICNFSKKFIVSSISTTEFEEN